MFKVRLVIRSLSCKRRDSGLFSFCTFNKERIRTCSSLINKPFQLSNKDMSTSEFPLCSLLPKKETGATSFLAKYPEYDGRGIKIAIFDTGVDPGAPGLQVTSHGLPKIVDMYDASGSGDVDTSTVVTAENGEITGLTGRKLKIPSSWKNPSGNYHIGIKNAKELYPESERDGVEERLEKNIKKMFWEEPQHKAETDIAKLLQKFEKDHPNSTETRRIDTIYTRRPSYLEGKVHHQVAWPPGLSAELKLEKEELEARAEMLKTTEKLLKIGVSYDCVVFHDGTMWRAVIDTSEMGDLENCTLLGPYSETFEYGTISKIDCFNYSINVYEEGNILQIVTLSGTHGTHVAGIAAAYFPEEPHKNGIAPGAQLVNIVLSDRRLNSTMETGASITRAVIKAIELKCDLINMSFGERCHWIGGRCLERLAEMVDKHGIIFITSAGNSGPALSTHGATPFITVGAYCSPEMMVALYSLREKQPGMHHTFTSRGPKLNGGRGATVSGPGAAFASMPNYTLEHCRMYNGTSMSSPNVCGGVALMLSGLKARGVAYSPYNVERALNLTSLKVPGYDPLTMGGGLLQVEKAFDYLLESESFPERDVDFRVTVNESNNGIYLREAYQLVKPSVHSVKITPLFLNEIEVEPTKKINFNVNFNLACDATWVHAPAHLCQPYGARLFGVKIDPTGLPHGVHYTSIRAYDSSNPDKGAVFEVPITVVIPDKIQDQIRHEIRINDLVMKPNNEFRQFIDVPVGATWASLKITSKDQTNAGSIEVHASQIAPQRGTHVNEFKKMFGLDALGEVNFGFRVLECRTLEICLAKWWSSIGEIPIDVIITLRGIKPSQPEIVMQPSCGIHRVDVTSTLKQEEIHPSATLKSHVVILRPTDNKIVPLGHRDLILKTRQIYELQLTYTFNVTKAAEVSPKFPLLCEYLYESEYDSQLWMLFDSNKRLILAGDYTNDNHTYSTKLEKGDYTIKLGVRHENKALLEKLTDSLFEVVFKLASPISLDMYYSWPTAATDGKKANSKKLAKGETVPIYIVPLPSDKLPKTGSPGHYLLGSISYAKDEVGKKVDTYPVKYLIPEAPKKASSPKPEKTKTPDEEYAEALRDIKITWIPKLQGSASDDLYKEVIGQHADNIQAIIARIQFLDTNKERPTDALKEIVKLSDQILNSTDLKELLAFFAAKNGKKQDPTVYKAQEKQKNAVIEALVKKGSALCDLLERGDKDAKSTEDSSKPVTLADVDEVFTEIQKWVDSFDAKALQFTEKHAKAHKQYGRALKAISKQLEEKPSIELEKSLIEMYEKLGWSHSVKFATNSLQSKYPPSYTLF